MNKRIKKKRNSVTYQISKEDRRRLEDRVHDYLEWYGDYSGHVSKYRLNSLYEKFACDTSYLFWLYGLDLWDFY